VDPDRAEVNPTARVLVVDDDRAVRTVLRVNLSKRGHDVLCVNSAHEAMAQLHEAPFDVVLTDVNMPGATGLDLLERVRKVWPDIQVVVMTGYGSVEDAVRAMKAGAADYIIKPIAREELYVILDRALENRTLRAELVQLRREVQQRYGFENIVGATPVMLALYEDVASVADSQATVLLEGQTGTGKELLAHALHYRSRRSAGPFVRVNCGAIPESLLESELFGHERGAFTGAIRQHRGKFEQADGGTLFLDEIGEIDPAMQVKLLRVLESGELQRVGGSHTIKVDVRVVAATNRSLRDEVAAGNFREDLYYRLNVVTLRVPPLRERRADIPLLVQHFVRRLAEREEQPVPKLTHGTVARLQEHDWPGNVRELEHLCERAFLLARGSHTLDIPLPEQKPVEPLAPPPVFAPTPEPEPLPLDGATLPEILAEHERRILIAALKACDGVQAQAARRIGISKSNFNYRMKKLGISLRELRYQ
jgi:DNA-binding NtrC family response regulator